MTPPVLPVRIGIVGAGAVGSWVGGHLVRAGFDVTLIDPWPDHVAAIRSGGIVLTEPGNEHRVPVKALHVGEVQSLYTTPLDLAFICMKLYDTDWATALIAPYLAASGFIVTLQNGLIEERVAAVVGWGRTVGCIAGGLFVELTGPGHAVRARHAAQVPDKVFRVGEVHGRITPRALSVAEMLRHVAVTEVTTNLWGARWSKLGANAMMSALCAASGLKLRQLYLDPIGQTVMARLGGEAAAVGLALGFAVEEIFGLSAERWVAAAAGDPAAVAEARKAIQGQTVDMGENARSGMAQDLAKGRRTEIEYMNGYIAKKAIETGTEAPTHAALASLIRRMERGAARPEPKIMNDLLGAVEKMGDVSP